MAENQFNDIFKQLKSILYKYEKYLKLQTSDENNYCLDAGYYEKYKQDLFFGAVTIKKNYVSFHLMPVYVFPELLKGISPDLKKRMQGKSCFNLKQVNQKLFKELARLTKRGFDEFRKAKLLP
jgi:hypothetical protein